MASKTDATVKKKNKPLNKRPNLASKKTFHLSKPHQFNVCGEKYECSVDDGREGKTEYQLTAYVNPSFSLHEKDRVQPPAQARDEVTFAPHRRPGQFQDFVPRKTATNTISARIRENEISLPIMNTLVYQRPFFDPAENADSLVHIDVDDRIPLQPKSRHSKLAKIWDELNCCTKHRCEVRKDHISWPVVGSLVVRGPEGELEEALISLSIDSMLENIVLTETGVSDVYTRQRRSGDDGIFRKISKKSTGRRQLSDANVPLTTIVTNRILSHQD